MPQLMPLFWKMSIIMILYVMMMLLLLYFNKMKEYFHIVSFKDSKKSDFLW